MWDESRKTVLWIRGGRTFALRWRKSLSSRFDCGVRFESPPLRPRLFSCSFASSLTTARTRCRWSRRCLSAFCYWFVWIYWWFIESWMSCWCLCSSALVAVRGEFAGSLIYGMDSDELGHSQAPAAEWQSQRGERMSVCAGHWLRVAWIFAARCLRVKSDGWGKLGSHCFATPSLQVFPSMSRTFLYNIEIRNEFLETAWRAPVFSPNCKYAISRGQMGCVLEIVAFKFRWTGITQTSSTIQLR